MMIASRVVVVGLGTQYIYTERKTFFPSSYKETCKGLYNIIREKDYDTEENIRTEEKQEHFSPFFEIFEICTYFVNRYIALLIRVLGVMKLKNDQCKYNYQFLFVIVKGWVYRSGFKSSV